ncbi:MAG: DMT family transporter [Clostridia bacterium]|nr:DMT family transporter [Clostridia bacterium]
MKKKFDLNKMVTSPWFIVLGALLCCALWGSATPFIKMGYKAMFFDGYISVQSIILFAGIRFAAAGFITIAIYSIARKKILYPKRQSLDKIAIVAAFQTIIQYFFFYVGLANTSGAKGTIISGSSSFFAIFISSLIFRQEKLTVKKVVACVVGFAGIIAVNLQGLDFSMNFTGDAFVLFSSISLAFSSVLIKIFSKNEDPVVISGYQFMLGGTVMIIGGIIAGGEIEFFDLAGAAILVYLAFLSAIAYAVWGILLKFNPVSKVTIFSFMTPVFGVLLTKIMLPDESTVKLVNLLLSLVLVCAGVFMLNYTRQQKSVESSADSVPAEETDSE